jgi:putative acetyltransferase
MSVGKLVRVERADPTLPICSQLMHELSVELGALYDDDGVGNFTAAQVMVPRSAFVVAWIGDEAVGCGAIRPMAEPHVAEVKRMYVRPAMRGKGISRRMLLTLEGLAKEFDYTTLRLETGLRQPQAIGLYESEGYRRIPCFGDYALDPLSVCYEKQLADG